MKFISTTAGSGNNSCSDVPIPAGATDKRDKFTPICARCSHDITDESYTKTLDRCWHNSCFVCCACNNKLGPKCYSRDGFVFCQMDFRTQAWTLCSGCNKSITPDELVQRIHDYIFHVSCLTCSECKAHLQTGDKIFIVHGYPCKVYCHNDYKQHVIARNQNESAKVMPAGGQWVNTAQQQAYNQSFSHRPPNPDYISSPSNQESRGVFRPTPLPATSKSHPQMTVGPPASQAIQPSNLAGTMPSNSYPCQPIAQHPPNYKQEATAKQLASQQDPQQFKQNGHVPNPNHRFKNEQMHSPSSQTAIQANFVTGYTDNTAPPHQQPNTTQQQLPMPVHGHNGVGHNTTYFQGQSMQQSPAQSSDSNSIDMMDYRQSNPANQPPPPPNRGPPGVLNSSSAFSPCPPASIVIQRQGGGFAPPQTQHYPNGLAAHPKMVAHIALDDEKSSDNVSVSSENDLQCSPKSGASMGSSTSGGTSSNPNSVSSAGTANTPPAAGSFSASGTGTPVSNKRGPGNHLKGPQADYLRSYYLTNQKPSKEERDAIAAEIGVEAKTIATWFQNRRSKEKIRREKAAAAAASAGVELASENSQSSSIAHSPSASSDTNQPASSMAPSAPVLTQESLSQSMAISGHNLQAIQEHDPTSPAASNLSESSGYASYVIKDTNQPITSDYNMNAPNPPQDSDAFHQSNFGFVKMENNQQYTINQQANFDPNGRQVNGQAAGFPATEYYVTDDVTNVAQQYNAQIVMQSAGERSNTNEAYPSVQSEQFKNFQPQNHQIGINLPGSAQSPGQFAPGAPVQPQIQTSAQQSINLNMGQASTNFVSAQ